MQAEPGLALTVSRIAGRLTATPLKPLTVVPFGMEEGTGLRISNREFGLVVGEPAEFRFFTSAVRKNDQPGDLIEDFGDDLEELAPMEVNLPAEQNVADVVPVSFELKR